MAVDSAKAANEFIVIAGDVDDLCSLARGAQDFLDDVVVLLRPIDSAAELPDIDQIAHDVERADIVPAQEIEEGRGLAVARAEMQIGDPRGAE